MMSGDNPNSEIVVYVGDDGKPQIQARLQDEKFFIVQTEGDSEVSEKIEQRCLEGQGCLEEGWGKNE